MTIFNADRQKNEEVNNLLQKIKYGVEEQGGDSAYFPLLVIDGNIVKQSPKTQMLLRRLKKMGVIEFSERTCDEINKNLEENKKSKTPSLISEGWFVKPIEPQFSQLCGEYERKTRPLPEQELQKAEPQKPKPGDVKVGIEYYQCGDLEATFDKGTNRVISVSKNQKLLYVKPNGLRREDIVMVGELIKMNGGIVLKGNLLEAMGHNEETDNVLYRSADRLKRYGGIENIENMRGIGYQLG